MPVKNLFIFPFNGNGLEALDCLDDNIFRFAGFIDDDPSKVEASHAWPVFSRSVLKQDPDAVVLAVPGSPVTYTKRTSHIQSLGIPEDRFATVIHPAARLGKNVQIGINCLILAGVVITSNAQIGNHVCVLPNTVIHHDSVIGDYTLIGSNVAIAGGVTIGKNCYVGSGTNLINGITIGNYCLVGLGSNVISGFPDYSRIAGNPARALEKK